MNIYALKKEIIKIGKLMYEKNFIASNDGNISVKINSDLFIVTPTQISKAFLTGNMLPTINLKGEVVNGNTKPSSEIKMHLEVYKKRSDVNAVVHAHPVFATAFAANNIPLAVNILPEIIVTLGSVPVAPYATPSTDEVPQSISNYIVKTDALLLANHGVLTTGKDVWEAYFRLEQIEHYAKILFYARQIGSMNILSESDLNKLKEVKTKLGLTSKSFDCKYDNECRSNLNRLETESSINYEKIAEIIKNELSKLPK